MDNGDRLSHGVCEEDGIPIELMIQFCISVFALGVFWHYLVTFRKKKNIPELVRVSALIIMAAFHSDKNTCCCCAE